MSCKTSGKKYVDWVIWCYNALSKEKQSFPLSAHPIGQNAQAKDEYLTLLAVHRLISQWNKQSATNPAPPTGRMVYWFKHELVPAYQVVEDQNAVISAAEGVNHQTGDKLEGADPASV